MIVVRWEHCEALDVNGNDLAIWDDLSMEISGTSTVRVALVGDSVEELLGDEGPVVMTFAGMTCPAPIVSSRLTGAKTSTGRRPTVPVNNEIGNADLPTQLGADLPNLWSEHPWRGVGPRRRSASVAVPWPRQSASENMHQTSCLPSGRDLHAYLRRAVLTPVCRARALGGRVDVLQRHV